MAKKIRRVPVDQFADAVKEVLQEFGQYVTDVVVVQAVHETAKETAELVSAKAPALTGKYKNSITYGYPSRKKHVHTETVYAENPDYRLTHLLEKGHASRNGERVPAYPHWESGEEGAGERLRTKIKEALQ